MIAKSNSGQRLPAVASGAANKNLSDWHPGCSKHISKPVSHFMLLICCINEMGESFLISGTVVLFLSLSIYNNLARILFID
jgi:hypothetical protein